MFEIIRSECPEKLDNRLSGVFQFSNFTRNYVANAAGVINYQGARKLLFEHRTLERRAGV